MRLEGKSNALTKPEDKYPLPEQERRAIVAEMLRSDAILLILGIILSIVATGLTSGDWHWTLVYFGWGYHLGQALTLGTQSLFALAGALSIAAVGCGFALLLDKVMWPRSESYRRDTYEMRAGINGELPRLSPALLGGLTLLVGFSEEFAFRYGLIGVLLIFFGQFFDATATALCAVLIASVLFTVIHGQYARLWERLFVAMLAIAFGLLFVASGSLLAVALSHALYDFSTVLAERYRMAHDDGYFGESEPPNNVIGDLIDQLFSGKDDE